jgi:uncharacterized protein YjiS (DUF1127 family)
MGPISAFFTPDMTTAAAPETKPSVIKSAFSAASAIIADARKAAADRNLRRELAAMDDALLRDIGVAEDEIYLIRAGRVFTPRAWNPTTVAQNWAA